MNILNIKKNFENLGYVKIDCIDKKKLLILRRNFAHMIKVSLKKNLNYSVIIKNETKKINYYLNEGMILLEKSNHAFLSCTPFTRCWPFHNLKMKNFEVSIKYLTA